MRYIFILLICVVEVFRVFNVALQGLEVRQHNSSVSVSMITTADDSHNASGFDFTSILVTDWLLLDIAKCDTRHVVHERTKGRRAGLPIESSDIVNQNSTICVGIQSKRWNAISASQRQVCDWVGDKSHDERWQCFGAAKLVCKLVIFFNIVTLLCFLKFVFTLFGKQNPQTLNG